MTSSRFARTRTYIFSVAAAGLLMACAPGAPTSSSSWEGAAEQDGALRVCASGPTVEGVDVSYYEQHIDWPTLAGSSVKFAIVRVGDGYFKDPKFAQYWAGAKSVGLVRGVYQFFRPEKDPIQQADILINALANDPIGDGDLPAVIDVEVSDGVSNATVRANMHTWLDRVEQATGKKPIIYTAAFMQTVVGSGFSDYPLWDANYTSQCPLVPSGWSGWNMWQYSEKGSVPGISGQVDRSVFNGTLQDLLAFAGGAPSSTNPPPTSPPSSNPPPSNPPSSNPPSSNPPPSMPPSTSPPDPNVPTGLTPTDGSSVSGSHEAGSSVHLSCASVTGASGYEFEIQNYEPGSSSWVAYYTYSTTSPGKTFWPVVDAAYRFRARSTSASGDSASSDWSAFSFGGAPIP